jgi:uncharacterized membrane protein YfcA
MSFLALALLLLAVAFLYASVGHGGASGYIAVMTLLGFAPDVVRPTALLLNLFVSGVAFAQFARAGHFRWPLLRPFVLASVPAAAIGARIHLDGPVYARVLAVCLVVAVARLLGVFGGARPVRRAPHPATALAIGAVLGLVSGMIGIGGGILLSPLLLLCGWADPKESAAVSAAFILVNSAAGLLSLAAVQGPAFLAPAHTLWIVAALVGGAIGAHVGARRMGAPRLRQVMGLVLLLAAVKLWTL